MTVSEILAGIVVRLLILFIITLLVCIFLYFSPISDRLLAVVLLVFVLWEMEVEYGLWFFTYRLGRKTEGPMIRLQKFADITGEGWRRAEIILKLTTPFFNWLESIQKRAWPDWKKGPEPAQPAQPTAEDAIVEALRVLNENLEKLDKRLSELERSR